MCSSTPTSSASTLQGSGPRKKGPREVSTRSASEPSACSASAYNWYDNSGQSRAAKASVMFRSAWVHRLPRLFQRHAVADQCSVERLWLWQVPTHLLAVQVLISPGHLPLLNPRKQVVERERQLHRLQQEQESTNV